MLRILKRFFDFCGAENKKKFYKALFCGICIIGGSKNSGDSFVD